MRLSSLLTVNRRTTRACLTTVLLLGLAVSGVRVTRAAVATHSDRAHDACDPQQPTASAPAIALAVSPATDDLPPLPEMRAPVDSPENLRDAYEFVLMNPEVAKYMPCFCACGRDKIHKSVEDCYIKSRGATPREVEWSGHAGECMICVAVGLEARRLTALGKSVSEIRDEIERTLAPKFKWHTDTPMPPKHHH